MPETCDYERCKRPATVSVPGLPFRLCGEHAVKVWQDLAAAMTLQLRDVAGQMAAGIEKRIDALNGK